MRAFEVRVRAVRGTIALLIVLALGAGALGVIAALARGPSAGRLTTGRCAGLKPTIFGTTRGRRIVGTAHRDVILGGSGADTILGRGGDDVICGGGGADTIDGGAGNDKIAGGPGADTLAGGAGNDAIGGGFGSDRVSGGDGDDRDYGGMGDDTIDPGAGADAIFGGRGADTIEPGDGASTIVPDPLDGVSDPGDPAATRGSDVRIVDPSAEQLLGADSDPSDQTPPEKWADHVDPGAGDDTVMGSPGDDTVLASAGDDKLDGGTGNDTLAGGDGRDTIDGGDGGDKIDGGDGADDLRGDAGQDTIDAGAGDDRVLGGADPDNVQGGQGADSIDGGDGGDTLVGGPDDASDGADTIEGGDSVDKLTGGGGDDVLDGGAGTDASFGDTGNDTIRGGAGFDDSYGGPGTDSCADSEENFLCEQQGGAQDTALVRDAPADAGFCDAWAYTTGDDANPGTAARPYRTAERLVNALRPGQTGCLEPGATFREPDFELHVRGGGQPGAPVVLRTAPAAGGNATIEGRVWVDEGVHDLRFEALSFDGKNPLARLRGVGAALPSPTVDGDRIAFFGDDVTTSGTATCFVIGSVIGYGIAEDVSIDGTRVHDCGVPTPPDAASGDHGIDLEASRNARVRNSYIYDNSDKGVLLYPDAQGTQIANNVIDRNRIALHYGTAVSPGGDWIYPAGAKVMPENNPATNNVITNSRFGFSDPFHWQVEGNKDWAGAPDPAGNLVDGNCFWQTDASRDVQQPNVAFTEGSNNLAGPPSNSPPQPAGGPGYVNDAAKDFRLAGGPGQCPRTFGPEDPPEVTTLDYDPATNTVGYAASDNSRSSGSVVTIEFRSAARSTAPAAWQSAEVDVPPGRQVRGRVPLPVELGADPLSFQAVGRGPSGYARGEVKTVTAPVVVPPASRPLPKIAKTANLVKPRGGKARLPGLDVFHGFLGFAQVQVGTEVDARRGPIRVDTLGNDGTTGQANVRGGLFTIGQRTGPGATTTFHLSKHLKCARRGQATASGSRRRNHLYVHWRHRHRHHNAAVGGRWANASAQGTRFFVEDRCEGTYIAVQEGSVLVKDYSRRHRFRLRQGHHYLATPRRRR